MSNNKIKNKTMNKYNLLNNNTNTNIKMNNMSNMSNMGNIGNMNENLTTKNHSSNIECIICFDEISPTCKYYFCETCGTAAHMTCYKNWWGTQPNKNKFCVHCQEKNTLILLKPHTKKRGSLLCRFIYWVLS
tara:strand:+ start:813 stop:1208 length:396 start_codon:yes stop_codon:yes gene_type:complete